MKTNIVLALTVALSAPIASAYEIQHVEGYGDQIAVAASSVANSMKFVKSELANPLATAKAKRDLAACMIDMTIFDADEYGLGDEFVNHHIMSFKKVYSTPKPYWNIRLSDDDVSYALMQQYRCIDQHPSINQAIEEEIIRELRDNNDCVPQDNMMCIIKKQEALRAQLKEKHGVK